MRPRVVEGRGEREANRLRWRERQEGGRGPTGSLVRWIDYVGSVQRWGEAEEEGKVYIQTRKVGAPSVPPSLHPPLHVK